jgi:hypothetical protein
MTVTRPYKRKATPAERWRKLSSTKKEYLMTVIYGTCYANERMEKENADAAPKISVDHNYYNGQHAAQKEKEGKDLMKPSGYEKGYNGKTDGSDEPTERVKKAVGGNVDDDDREKYALGGAAKIRKHYPGI